MVSLSTGSSYVAPSKRSRNSLVKFTCFDCQAWSITSPSLQIKLWIKKCTLPSFVAVRRKLPEKWRTNSWFLLHDNAPTHRPVLVKDFLAKKNMTTLQHLPHSPDSAPADFYLFPRCNQHWRDGVFVMLLTIMNAAEEPKRPSQNGLQECFHHLYSR
jgi:hypothetical protein